MYGHWYPHGCDGLTFARALLTQCRAIVLSMAAIRQVNPAAQLVQTEDLGKIFSTPLLAYQAELENERRWLSFDLLCGRVNRDHPMWHHLRQFGVDEAELEVFLNQPCPPDIFGINHYLTSDRFLDERLENYPSHSHGGNGRHEYADVEAVRVCESGAAEPHRLMQEVWERYQLPIAITEVHLGCTREEQLRWLKEVWDAAILVQSQGVDVRAITVWSLLGAYDWNSLVTRADGYYEPGVFDLRCLVTSCRASTPHPRPTALARMMRDLARGQVHEHPLLDLPGWWKRPERLLYPPVSCAGGDGEMGDKGTRRQGDKGSHLRASVPPVEQSGVTRGVISSSPSSPSSPLASRLSPLASRPILITGATGTLGSAFARICDIRGIPYCLLKRQDMDITDRESVDTALKELQPWAVVNAAGYVRVDDAQREVEACRSINADGPAILAQSCQEWGVALLTFSSDLVFDGNSLSPYVESNAVAPLNVYGDSKAEAEVRVLEALPSALVIRTSAFFGPWDNYNFLTIALRTLAAGQPFQAAFDATVSPTYVPDLVQASLDLLIDGECGLWHLANPGAIAWVDLARFAAQKAGLDATHVHPVSTSALGLVAPRPTYSVLGSERGILLPSLENAIARYFDERQDE
jgi:dTDP-4-dehydrorhamnose reductase